MKSIKEAKGIWIDSPYDDKLINVMMKLSDNTWEQFIVGAEKNEAYLYQWVKECRMMGITTSFEDLALEFLSQMIKDHEAHDTKKIFIIPMIMLMSHKIADIWLGMEALKNVRIIIRNK